MFIKVYSFCILTEERNVSAVRLIHDAIVEQKIMLPKAVLKFEKRIRLIEDVYYYTDDLTNNAKNSSKSSQSANKRCLKIYL